jgi:DedD protein
MAANQLSEEEIQFRKRARRRLVGAIALVLLMVTVLPMVLSDRQAKTPPQDIAISIPSQDGGNFTSHTMPVAPQQGSAPVELAPPLAQPNTATQEKTPEPTSASNPGSNASAQKKEAVKNDTPKNGQVTSSPAQAEDAPQENSSKQPDQAASKPTPKTESKSHNDPKPANPQKTPAKKGAFTVQIGVYTEGPKLTELVKKLGSQGFHVSQEKLETPKGTKIRLRTGSYSNRSDAESAVEKLKSAGVAAMVVAVK